MTENPEVMKKFAEWARANGKKRPDTKEGMQALFSQFAASLAADEIGSQEKAQHYHHEITAGDQPVHLINDGSTVQIADELHEGIFEDDWHRLLRDRAKAAIGPNGEMLDDFDTEFQLGQKNHAELQSVAPFTRSNPPSATTAVLGGQFNAKPGDLVTVARWDGATDAETLPVTVTLGPCQAPQADSFAQAQYRPFARVQWGTRGILLTAEVDIGRGQQFTINASTVILSLGLENNSPPTTKPIALTGMLSFNSCVRTERLYRTVYTNASNLGLTVVIPAFANSVKFFRANSKVGIRVFFADYQNFTICSASIAATAFVPAIGTDGEYALPEFPIPGNAYYMQFFLEDPLTPGETNVTAIFGLCM